MMSQNEGIVFYQTSNGTFHTASTQEQIYETTNIQLPLASTTVNEATRQYSEVFNGNIIEAEPMQQIKIIKASDIIQSNNIIRNVVQTETDEDNIIQIPSFIRVSGINTKRKSFQLVTDHLQQETNLQPKTVAPYVKTLNMNGTITRTVLVPQNAFKTTQVDTNESILSGKYIVTHKEIPSFKPKTSVKLRDNSFIVQNNDVNGLAMQLIDTIKPNGKILVQRIRKKTVKLKNGAQVKTLTNPIKSSNDTNLKIPLSSVTPVPISLKPVKKILVQPETLDLLGVEQVQNRQLHVITDAGNTIPVSVESQNKVLYEPTPPKARIIFKIMQPEDFQLYTQAEVEDSTKLKPINIKLKQEGTQEKPITVSKVNQVNEPNKASKVKKSKKGDGEDSKKSRNIKATQEEKPEKIKTPSKKVTRSGRQVHPPKHITPYDDLDKEDILEDLDYDVSKPNRSTTAATSLYTNGAMNSAANSISNSDTIVPAVMEDAGVLKAVTEVKQEPAIDKFLLRKKRIKCITCQKVYGGIHCLGQHLMAFPEHATTDRLTAVLERYRNQAKLKNIAPKPPISKMNASVQEQKTIPPVSRVQVPNINNAMKRDSISSISDELESKEESNIFISLIRLVERTSEECKAAVFIRQLSALILKLKRLMPCLLFEDKNSTSCMINESVGKMLEVKPGKYKLNMHAIKCPGEQSGNCPHIPPKPEPKSNNTPSWLRSDQNNCDKISSPSTLITSKNNDLNKWNSTDKNEIQNNTNNDVHKWSSAISNDIQTNSNNDIHKWSSTISNGIQNNSNNGTLKWSTTVNSSIQNNTSTDTAHTWSNAVSNGITNIPINDQHKWSSAISSDTRTTNTNGPTWSSTVTSSIQNNMNGDDSHKWSSTVTNSIQNNMNGDSNKWSSAVNSRNHDLNSDEHKWSSTVGDDFLETGCLNKWKSPKKSKKKTKINIPKWTPINESSSSEDNLHNWTPVTNDNSEDQMELGKWIPVTSSNCQSKSDVSKWINIGSNGQDNNGLNTWTSTVSSANQNKDEMHNWANTTAVNCQDKNELQWATTVTSSSCHEKDNLCSWKSTDKNECQENGDLSKWTSAISNGCQVKDEFDKWKSTLDGACHSKDEWSSVIDNSCEEKESLDKWTPPTDNACQDKDDLNKWPSGTGSNCQEKNEMDKWTSTTNNGKRKWIPIGTRDPDENSNTNDGNWLSGNSDMLLDNATFSQTVDNMKSWDPLQKENRLQDCTPRSPWQANIPELNKIDTPQEIIRPQDHITSSSQPVPSDDSMTFDCTTKMVEDIHSNLVFDMNKDISLDSDVDLKKKSMEPENFDFNDSRFDMQIEADKLNFESAQYNEMKYGPNTLPPFRKIEPSKNLQLPVDSLSDTSSDIDKLRLPSSDGILSELGPESLGLTISNEHIEPMDTVETRKDVTLSQSENAVHCDQQSLLNSSDLNLPTCSASNLNGQNESILSVSESSLDGSRLNLNLLDSLGPDCLSFADSDLRTTSQMSLDLQDLFPFHHN